MARRHKGLEYWILDDKRRPVQVDLLTWARWFETGSRVLRQEHVGNHWVSTIFLGIDHSFTMEGPPVLWETMAFKSKMVTRRVMGRELTYRPSVYSERCAGSVEQAEAMHAAMVRRVRKLSRRKSRRKSKCPPGQGAVRLRSNRKV